MLRALAEEVNKKPLPAIPDSYGIRLPPPEYQTTLPNLQWHVEGGAEAGESPAEEPTVRTQELHERGSLRPFKGACL